MIHHQVVEHARLTSDQLIDRVLTLAPTLGRERLVGFTEAELDEYLAHLECAQHPRDRHARWHRDGLTRPVCSRRSRI